METAELNIDAAADSIVADMGLGVEQPDDLDKVIDKAADTPADDAAVDTTTAPAKANGADKSETPAKDASADAPIPMPKSWAKEQQEVWDEMTPRARAQYIHREKQMLDGLEGYKGDAEYGRSLRSVLSKHEDILRSQGIAAPQAVEYLFNAHRQLSSGTQEQKLAYAQRLFKTYGIEVPQAAAAADGAQPAALAPEVKAALERLDRIEGALTQEQTQRYEAVRQQTAKDVEAFAADPKNAYFDEVAEDIAVLIKTGLPLDQAYEKAVWANPVTRQKEISRLQQETEKANREKADAAAKAAKRATSTNVRGRDTTRAPTGTRATLNNMDEVLSETLAEIKQRH